MPANRIKLEPALERRYAKRKERRKKRPVTCKILIVCEGTKTDKCNYQIMNTYGSMEKAIRFAEAKSREYNDRRYASHNPCTMVFKLVRQLIGKDTVFNEEIKHKIDNK